ncbi:uncharacterized protein [Haliotis asinina]|uniref:uncharacterized protein n=1 Tax=Haliotis asinina TaxID=109174 RepID=UPI00353212C9
MADCPRLNNSGLPLYHLSRFGPPASLPTVPDVMDLNRVTTIIGRNPLQANYVLDSSNPLQRGYISRLHARIIREGNRHKLYDDSMNGVFINHIKITGFAILNEGDLVTFGHPNGKNVPAGARKRQADSEYQFLFGRCDCRLPGLPPATTLHSSTPAPISEVQIPTRLREPRQCQGQTTCADLQDGSSVSAEQRCHITSDSATCTASRETPAVTETRASEFQQGGMNVFDSGLKTRQSDGARNYDDAAASRVAGLRNSPEAAHFVHSCPLDSKSVFTKVETDTEDFLPVPTGYRTEDENDMCLTDEAPVEVIEIFSDSEEDQRDDSMKDEESGIFVKREQTVSFEVHDSGTDMLRKCHQSSGLCVSGCSDVQPLSKRLKIDPSGSQSAADKILSTNTDMFCANSTSPVFSTSGKKRKVVSHRNSGNKRPKKQWTFSVPIEVASSSYKMVESSEESNPNSESEVTEQSASLCSSREPSLEPLEINSEQPGSFQLSEYSSSMEQLKKRVPKPSFEASEDILESKDSYQNCEMISSKDVTSVNAAEPQFVAEPLCPPSFVPSVQSLEIPKDVPGTSENDSVVASRKGMDGRHISEKPLTSSVVDPESFQVTLSQTPDGRNYSVGKEQEPHEPHLSEISADSSVLSVSSSADVPLTEPMPKSESIQGALAEYLETPVDSGEDSFSRRQDTKKSHASGTSAGTSVLVASQAYEEPTVEPSPLVFETEINDVDVSVDEESPVHDAVKEIVPNIDASMQLRPPKPVCDDIQVTVVKPLEDKAESESCVPFSSEVIDSKYCRQESRPLDTNLTDKQAKQYHDTLSDDIGSDGNKSEVTIDLTTQPEHVLNSFHQEHTLCANSDITNPLPSDEVVSITLSSVSCDRDIGGVGEHEQNEIVKKAVHDHEVCLTMSAPPYCLEKDLITKEPEARLVSEMDAVPNVVSNQTGATSCEQTDTVINLMCEQIGDAQQVCVHSDDMSEMTNSPCGVDLETVVHKEEERHIGINACESTHMDGVSEHASCQDNKYDCSSPQVFHVSEVTPDIREIQTRDVLSRSENQCKIKGAYATDTKDQTTSSTRHSSISNVNSPILLEDQLISSEERQLSQEEGVTHVPAAKDRSEMIDMEGGELSRDIGWQGTKSNDHVSVLTEDVDANIDVNPSAATHTHTSLRRYQESDVLLEDISAETLRALHGTAKEVKRETMVQSESSSCNDMAVIPSPRKGVITVDLTGDNDIVLKGSPGKVVTKTESIEDEDSVLMNLPGEVVTPMEISEGEDLVMIESPGKMITIASTVDEEVDLRQSHGKVVRQTESTEDIVIKEEDEDVLKVVTRNEASVDQDMSVDTVTAVDVMKEMMKRESNEDEDSAVIDSGNVITPADKVKDKVVLQQSALNTIDDSFVMSSPQKLTSFDLADKEDVVKVSSGDATENERFQRSHTPESTTCNIHLSTACHSSVQEDKAQDVRESDDSSALKSIVSAYSTIIYDHKEKNTCRTESMSATLEEKMASQESGNLDSGKYLPCSARGTGCEHFRLKGTNHAEISQKSDVMEPSKSASAISLNVDVDSIEDEDELSPVIPHQETFTNLKKSEEDDNAVSDHDFSESQADLHLYLSQAEDSQAMTSDNFAGQGDHGSSLTLFHEVVTQDQECQGEMHSDVTSGSEGQGEIQVDVTSGDPKDQGDIQANVTSGDPEGQGDIQVDVTSGDLEDHNDMEADMTSGDHEGQGNIHADVTSGDPKGQDDMQACVTSGDPEGQGVIHSDVTSGDPEGQGNMTKDVTSIEAESQGDIPADLTSRDPEGQGNIQAGVTSGDLEDQDDMEADMACGDPVGQGDIPADLTSGDPEGQDNMHADVNSEDPKGQDNMQADVTSEDLVGQGDMQADVTSGDPVGQGNMHSDVTSGDPEGECDMQADVTSGDPEGDSDKEADVTSGDLVGQGDMQAYVIIGKSEGQDDMETELTSEDPENEGDIKVDVTSGDPENEGDIKVNVTSGDPEGHSDKEADVTSGDLVVQGDTQAYVIIGKSEGQDDMETELTSEDPENEGDIKVDVTSGDPEGQDDIKVDVTSGDPEGQGDIKVDVTSGDPEIEGDIKVYVTSGDPEGHGDMEADVTSGDPEGQGDMPTDLTSGDPEGQCNVHGDATIGDYKGQGEMQADVTSGDPEGHSDIQADVTSGDLVGQRDTQAYVIIGKSEGQDDMETELTSEDPENEGDIKVNVTSGDPEGHSDKEADVTSGDLVVQGDTQAYVIIGKSEGQDDMETELTSEDPENEGDIKVDVTSGDPEGQDDIKVDVTSGDPEGQGDIKVDVTSGDPEIEGDIKVYVTSGDPEGHGDMEADVTSGDPEGQGDMPTDLTSGDPEGQCNVHGDVTIGDYKGQGEMQADVTSGDPEGHSDIQADVTSGDLVGQGDMQAYVIIGKSEGEDYMETELTSEDPENEGDIKVDVTSGDPEGQGVVEADVTSKDPGDGSDMQADVASEDHESQGDMQAKVKTFGEPESNGETDIQSHVTLYDDPEGQYFRQPDVTCKDHEDHVGMEADVAKSKDTDGQGEPQADVTKFSKTEVQSDTDIQADLTICDDTEGQSDSDIQADLTMYDDTDCQGDIDIQADKTMYGDTDIQVDLTIHDDIEGEGDNEATYMMSNVTVVKDLKGHGDTAVKQAANSTDNAKVHDEDRCLSSQSKISQKCREQEESFDFSMLGTDFSASTPKPVSDSLVVNCDDLSYQKDVSAEPSPSRTSDVKEVKESEHDPEGSAQGETGLGLVCKSDCQATDLRSIPLTENSCTRSSNKKEVMRSFTSSDDTDLHLHLSGIESQTDNTDSCFPNLSQPELTPSPTGTDDPGIVNDTPENDSHAARPHNIASGEEALLSDEDLHLVMTTSDESQLHNDSAVSGESADDCFVSPVIKFKASKESNHSKMLGKICESEPLCSSSVEQHQTHPASDLESSASQLNLWQEVSQSSCNSGKGDLTSEDIFQGNITDDDITCTQESIMSGIAPLELSNDADEPVEASGETSQETSLLYKQKVEALPTFSFSAESNHDTVSEGFTENTRSVGIEDRSCDKGHGFAKYGSPGSGVKIVREDLRSSSGACCDDHTVKEKSSAISLYKSRFDSEPTFIAEPLFRVDHTNTIIFDAIDDVQSSDCRHSFGEDISFHEKSNMDEKVPGDIDMVKHEQACNLSASKSADSDGEGTEERDSISAIDPKSARYKTTLLQPESLENSFKENLSHAFEQNVVKVPDLDDFSGPETITNEPKETTSSLPEDYHTTEFSKKPDASGMNLPSMEVNEYDGIESRLVKSEQVTSDEDRMKMMNYIDFVTESEESLAIIDLRDDRTKVIDVCSLSPTDCQQMRGLDKVAPPDKNHDEMDWLADDHHQDCNRDGVVFGKSSLPFLGPIHVHTDYEATEIKGRKLISDADRGCRVAARTSNISQCVLPEEQCLQMMEECCSNAPNSRKRKASEDRSVEKRSWQASLSLKTCLGSMVAKFFLIRESVKAHIACNPTSDKQKLSFTCWDSSELQEQHGLSQNRQGIIGGKHNLTGKGQGFRDDQHNPGDGSPTGEQHFRNISDDAAHHGLTEGLQETKDEQGILFNVNNSKSESCLTIKQKMTSASHVASENVVTARVSEPAVNVDSIREEAESKVSPSVVDLENDMLGSPAQSASTLVMEEIHENLLALEPSGINVDGDGVIVITDSDDEVDTDNILSMETSKVIASEKDKEIFDQDDHMLLGETSNIIDESKQTYYRDGDIELKGESNADENTEVSGSESCLADDPVKTEDVSDKPEEDKQTDLDHDSSISERTKEPIDQDDDVFHKETSCSDTPEESKVTYGQDTKVHKNSSKGDIADGSKGMFDQETSVKDTHEGSGKMSHTDDDVLLNNTSHGTVLEKCKMTNGKDKEISAEDTYHSDSSAESRSMFEKDMDIELECDEDDFCTDEDTPESKETSEESWRADAEDETDESSTYSSEHLTVSEDIEAYTDEDTPDFALEMKADTDEDLVNQSYSPKDILETSDQRSSNSSQGSAHETSDQRSSNSSQGNTREASDQENLTNTSVKHSSSPDAHISSRSVTDVRRLASDHSGTLPDTASEIGDDAENTPADASLSLGSSLSVHTLESDYDSDVYITECRLVVKAPTVKTEHEDEDDDSHCGKGGRHSSKKQEPNFGCGDDIQMVDCSSIMESGKSGNRHLQNTGAADSLFDMDIVNNGENVHLNDSSGFEIKDQGDTEIDAGEDIEMSGSGMYLTVKGEDVSDTSGDKRSKTGHTEESSAKEKGGKRKEAISSNEVHVTNVPSDADAVPADSSRNTSKDATDLSNADNHELTHLDFTQELSCSSTKTVTSFSDGTRQTPNNETTVSPSVAVVGETSDSSTKQSCIPVHLQMDFSEDVDCTSSPGVDVGNIIAGLEQDSSDTDSDRRCQSDSLDDIFDDTCHNTGSLQPETAGTSTSVLADSGAKTTSLTSASTSGNEHKVVLIDPAKELLDLRCKSLGRITPEVRKEAEWATSVTPENRTEKRQDVPWTSRSVNNSFEEDGDRSSSTCGIAASTEDDDNVEDFPMLSAPKKRSLNRQDNAECETERSRVEEVTYSSDEDTSYSMPISDQDVEFSYSGSTKCSDVEEKADGSPNTRDNDNISKGHPSVSLMNVETHSSQRMCTSVDDLSSSQLSQLDRRLSAAPEQNLTNVRRKSLLESIRAKRRSRLQCDMTAKDEGETHNMNTVSQKSGVCSKVKDSLTKVEDFLARCKKIVAILTDSFNTSHTYGNSTVQAWWDKLQSLKKTVQLPTTIIAVVGDTGAGKSSLLNALLNQPCVLPTSGVQACTAVVVEIMENTHNQNYEADIHFLSREEWLEELEVLLNDLTKRDGSLQTSQPDPTSEAGVAYAKVKAVYGKVRKMNVLLKQTHITQWLSRIKTISVQSAKALRDEVNSYIENTDNGSKSQQFWPIVKQVKLYLPSCEVCSSGAVLVDLPGVRDANAARDKIAKEYLKNCMSVWVVASIHRAIDDHTAKDLLGENFRRQLLMDGQYGNVAFICTKTDSLIPSELKKLTPNFDNLNKKLKTVLEELSVLESHQKFLKQKQSKKESEIDVMKTDYQELKEGLDQAKRLLDEEAVAELKDELEIMDVEMQQKEADMADILVQERDVAQQVSAKKDISDIHQRKLVAMCAKARNDYSMKQIKKDFRAGIRELKQKSENVYMEEDDILDYDEDDEDDEDDTGNMVDNLEVFCVSSTDYMKMTKLLTDVDGAPQVFSTPDETQIPALREFVHTTSLQQRDRTVRQIVEKLGLFVFDVDNYLKMSEYNGKGSGKVQPIVTKHVTALLQKIDPIVSQLSEDIQGLFNSHLIPNIEGGCRLAGLKARTTSDRWGSKVNKENRHLGGLAFMTYRATVSRQGKYNSPTAGPVDFNYDLALPLLVAVAGCWNKVFGSLFWCTLEKVNASMMAALGTFNEDVKNNLTLVGFDSVQIETVILQIHRNTTAKLNEMVDLMKDYVTSQQREISRIITPNIQAAMLKVYDMTSREHGIGCYNRMKQMMAMHVDSCGYAMFDETVTEIKNRLSKLQESVVEKVKGVLMALCRGFKVYFEPLWQSPDSCHDLRQNFSAGVSQCLIELHQLFLDCGLPLPVLMPDTVAEPDTAEVVAEETVDDVLGALRHDVEDSLKRLEEPQGCGVKQEPYVVSGPKDVFDFDCRQEDTSPAMRAPYHSVIKSEHAQHTGRLVCEERQTNVKLTSTCYIPTETSTSKLLAQHLQESTLSTKTGVFACGNKSGGSEFSLHVPDPTQVTAFTEASGVGGMSYSHMLDKQTVQQISPPDNTRQTPTVAATRSVQCPKTGTAAVIVPVTMTTAWNIQCPRIGTTAVNVPVTMRTAGNLQYASTNSTAVNLPVTMTTAGNVTFNSTTSVPGYVHCPRPCTAAVSVPVAMTTAGNVPFTRTSTASVYVPHNETTSWNAPPGNSHVIPKRHNKLCLNAKNLKRPASFIQSVALPGTVPIKQEAGDEQLKKPRLQVDEVLDLTGDSDGDTSSNHHSTNCSSSDDDDDLPSYL